MSRPVRHLEQRTAVRRYAQFVASFSVVAVLISAFLVFPESPGGWALLASAFFACLVVSLLVQESGSKQPRRGATPHPSHARAE
ncbi:hypothetical protein AB0M42_09335 [Streptomyces sp. NPDC051784]|uniref:hypothetical protein n=1 Tax=Streptomyces sp. NPDC051784 TaxID=3155805 RepID=UPI003449B087